jgi:autotransporter-associated beta strand protein
MATNRTTNSLAGTVPQLGDTANIETAFNAYHDSLANTSTGAAVLNRANTFTGNIAINNGTSTALTTTGTTAALFNTNVITLNIGQAATSIVIGATTGQTAVRNDLVLSVGKRLILEGATNNDFETILTVVDPTADRTITLPDLTGTVALLPSRLVISTDVTDSLSGTSSTNKTSAALGKYLTVSANTTYEVNFSIRIYHSTSVTGSGSVLEQFRFTLPSGTINSDINYRIDYANATEDYAAAETSIYKEINSSSTSVAQIISSSSGTEVGYSVIRGSGILRVGATGGSFGPSIYLAITASGSTVTTSFTVAADSYFRVQEIGTTGEVNTGGWA